MLQSVQGRNHDRPTGSRKPAPPPAPRGKAQLLQSVINDIGDAFPGIESRNGVCGGEPCITRTRIPVWVLEQARRLNVSEADILKSYPTLRAEDLAHAWAYVRSHRAEIDAQIIENETA